MVRINALDVAQWFYNNNETVRANRYDSHLKLQKLVYYSQAMNSSVYGKPLYKDAIEAWENGPVVRKVFIKKRYENEELERNIDKPLDFSDKELQILNVVNSVYGVKTAEELKHQTHKELPWANLREDALNRNNPTIEFESIKDFYTDLKDIFEAYEGFNFENERVETINGNNFCYMADNISKLTEEDLSKLYSIGEERRDHTYNVSKFTDENGTEQLVVY